MRTPGARAVRALLGASGAAAIASAAIAASGGVSMSLAGIPVRAHDPVRAAILSALLAAVACTAGRGALIDALAWWWRTIDRRGVVPAGLLAVLTVVIGVSWNTFTAGGSDSYCYLNQAELFLRGQVRDVEPLATDPAWPGTLWAFVPAGHMPAPGHRGASVPICPAGYPAMLAAARVAFGRTAMFFVTPLLGGAAVFLAFVLGRRAAGAAAGLLAALLTATSPTFLAQLVHPMNDVPAAALWCAALVLMSSGAGRREGSRHAVARTAASSAARRPPERSGEHRGPRERRREGSGDAVPRSKNTLRDRALRSAVLSGLVTGVALTIRPNLVPLAAVVGLGVALLPPRLPLARRALMAAAFGLAAVPGVLAVMAVQNAMYGSPFSSGYGDLSALFSASHVGPNLQRYPRWLLEVHTPLMLAALASPFVLRGDARRYAIWLLAFAGATLVCYLPYVVFDAWWYTRFLLPAVPPLLALTAAVVTRGVQSMPEASRAPVFCAACTAIAIVYLGTAVKRDAFRAQELERRFRSAGEYVATLSPDAAIVTVHQNGSVRFYSGRSTAAWTDIDAGRLDDALEFLRRHGRRPYLLLEKWEESGFKDRFAADRLGRLDWPPLAVIDDKVQIYDPDDFERHRRGERVVTQVVGR